MTDIDLDRLGDIWRRQPDPAELAELRRTAERVRRRARWTQIVDIAGAVVLSCVILFLVYRNPGLDTALFGGAAILLMLFSQVRQRNLRAAELKGLTGTAEQMLDQSIERIQAKLKYLRFGTLALGPSIILGILLGYAIEKRSGAKLFAIAAAQPGLIVLLQVACVVAAAAVAIYIIRSFRNGRRGLARLTVLREAYRHGKDEGQLE